MNFRLLILLIITAVYSSAFARHKGAYFGFGVGKSDIGVATRTIKDSSFGGRLTFSGKNLKVRNSNPLFDGDKPLSKGDQRSESFSINLGYQMNDYFAFEYRYNRFGEAEYRDDSDNKVFNKAYAMDVLGLGMVPIGKNWDLRGQMGITWMNSDLSVDGSIRTVNNGAGSYVVANVIKDSALDIVSYLYGVGLAYHWNEKTAITFDHVRFHGQNKISDASTTQIGLSFFFDGLIE